jgi:hypothetical protein
LLYVEDIYNIFNDKIYFKNNYDWYKGEKGFLIPLRVPGWCLKVRPQRQVRRKKNMQIYFYVTWKPLRK